MSHEFDDRVEAIEQHSRTRTANMWKESTFDRIVLRAIAGIVRDTNFHADRFGKLLEIVLEQVSVR